MFLPPKLTTIVLNSLALLMLMAGTSDAQQSEFNRRAMAMQEARSRAQQAPTVRLASNDDIGVDYSAPPSPSAVARVARSPQRTVSRQPSTTQTRSVSSLQAPPQRLAQGISNSGQAASRYVPEHIRTAQLMQSAIVDGGAPIIENGVMGSGSYENEIVGDEFVEGGCATCGDAGGYFNECDSCCGRGGCPPGDCWITGLGTILSSAEYFGGATSFRTPLFSVPTTAAGGDLFNDCSYGFYGGFNLGLPLCRLSCGLFSTQFGVRSVQTNFNGNEYTTADRDQTFMTLGFYRRVDYGFQAGIAIDYLNEKWITDVELTQLRGDMGWVYPNGTTLGFRYATNLDNAVSSGVINGVAFDGMVHSTQENYRFYGRRETMSGGFGESFVGWSNNSQTVFGLDFDLPLRDRVAMQSGFTYYLGDEGVPSPSNQLGGNANDAFNLYVGLVFRPRGLSYNRSYDRPLFSVADNGTMLMTRN